MFGIKLIAHMRAVVAASVAVAAFIASPLAHAQTGAAPASPVVAVSAQDYQYALGAGDKVRVIVFGEPDLSGEFTVSGEGKVSLPLIGEIDARGKTASVLQAGIADALKQGYLNNPRVAVEVLTFRPFYIFGEVNKPGEYPYVNGMTVDRAVATASGYTYRADRKKVHIKRANEQAETAVPLNAPVVVQPGDTIRIGERYF